MVAGAGLLLGQACQPCPAGVFGSSLGLEDDECDGPCPAGYACPPGSIDPYEQPCTDAATYCPAGR